MMKTLQQRNGRFEKTTDLGLKIFKKKKYGPLAHKWGQKHKISSYHYKTTKSTESDHQYQRQA